VGTLGDPVQDAAAAPAASGALLLGGLTAEDTSRSDIVAVVHGIGVRRGQLAGPLHDAAAATLGGRAYLFGGGNGTAQLDAVVSVDPGTGAVRDAGRLPAPSSDQAAAALGGSAYVVGGYTGARWLDTVVAWRPGAGSRVAGHLPGALRYAAVAAAGGRVIIAGGSRPDGTASDAVLAFDPRTGRVTRLGRLPAPTTHAAAAALGGTVYVIGGRGATAGSETARIVAIDARTGRVRDAGHLSSPRSDLAAVALGSRILLAGGRGAGVTLATVSELTPAARARAAARSTAPPSARNVYWADGAGRLRGPARHALHRIYVPNSQSDTLDVIDPSTDRVVAHYGVGGLPQHVVPSWDLRTLYVTNDTGNSLTPIDPRTGRPGRPIPVEDPYNLYFTPDGRYAIVVAERFARLDFRDPHGMRLRTSLPVPCRGVDHLDFTADGRRLLASCEFSGQLVMVDLRRLRVTRVIRLPRPGAMPQDVKLSPDGRLFYVADMMAGGLWEIDAAHPRVVGFLPTGQGAHGLYPSRDSRLLYVSNRGAGTVSVVSFASRRVVRTWRIPGGSPDMGGVSADGRVLWLSGRYDAEVYAIDTATGRVRARIPVGQGPHGLSVWPQPGRHSLGHTGIMR
jgi:YVTN family beta-propeller protein